MHIDTYTDLFAYAHGYATGGGVSGPQPFTCVYVAALEQALCLTPFGKNGAGHPQK